MASVTKVINESGTTYTISSIYNQIAINSLFSFINYSAYFRISRNNGSTWTEWGNLTEENLRAIEVDIESDIVVVQVNYGVSEEFLAINDTDLLNINDSGDNLKLT